MKTFKGYLAEGKLLDFAKGKLSKVVSSVSNFVKWAANKLSSIVSNVIKKGESFANKILGRNKGVKAVERLFSSIGQPLTESFVLEDFLAEGGPVKLTPAMVEDFHIVYDEFLGKKGGVNEIHAANVKLMKSLNSKKMAGRKFDPIQMVPDISSAVIATGSWKKHLKSLNDIQYISEGRKATGKFYVGKKPMKVDKQGNVHVTRDQLGPMFKIAANYTANVAIYGILKGIENEMSNYDNVSGALFSISGKMESEVKFGKPIAVKTKKK